MFHSPTKEMCDLERPLVLIKQGSQPWCQAPELWLKELLPSSLRVYTAGPHTSHSPLSSPSEVHKVFPLVSEEVSQAMK